MSLKDIDEFDEDDDEIELPRKKKRKLFTIPKKFKVWIVLIVIGLVIGIVLGHYYVEPIVNAVGANTCSTCIATKDILTKENQCLYNYINNAQMVVDGCST